MNIEKAEFFYQFINIVSLHARRNITSVISYLNEVKSIFDSLESTTNLVLITKSLV